MNNPLFDTSLSFEERINWLLKNLTLEEKMSWMSSRMPGCERLGMEPFGLGGEAAHGVEGRNDQWNAGPPDYSTSFPQPIGMSATWDPDLIEKCGEVVGREARVINKRHGGRGLSRWAPTVDLERDPRWGRNEEGYGEDPLLIGSMAGAYIRGMQGRDEKYIRCASTLKHFYANNTEEGRAWKNADADPRNKYELYLEPFRRCIEDHHVQGIMTAYNRINGKVGILNDDVKNILKKQYGLTHAVGDGGALNLVVSAQHYYGNHAQAVAAALKAGVDGMSDHPGMVEAGVREACSLGLIEEKDLDEAIHNKMMVAMRLGLFDGELCPYAHYTEADICTEEAAALALRAAEENLVLLKNDGLLPLPREKTVLIGPMGDTWFQDWYGGEPPCKKTIRDGLNAQGIPHAAFDGWHRVKLMFGSQGAYVEEDGSVSLSDTPDTFVMEDYGENSFLFRCVRTGKYLDMQLPEGSSTRYNPLGNDKNAPFNWFVLQIFRFEEKDGHTLLLNRFHWPVQAENGKLVSGRAYEGTPVTVEMVEDGIQKAVELAGESRHVVLALGQTPMIPAKEEYDRHTLLLPPHQRKLMEAVHRKNPRTVLVLIANYPHALPYAGAQLPAILLSASGGQEMGPAIANALFGQYAPAGRLNMTWYRDEGQLTSIDDYDIIRSGRTYRYFDGDVLFPFGHGLTYTTFRYGHFAVSRTDEDLTFSFTVENTGACASDEVVQVYAVAPPSRVQKPLRQLVAFHRLKDVQPGEKRTVTLTAPVSELRFYDVISRSLLVEAGEYRFFAGPSSQQEALSATLFIPGETLGLRDMTQRLPADHYDDCEAVSILQGTLGFASVGPRTDAPAASVTYRDCRFTEDCAILSLRLKSEQGGKVTVKLNGHEIGTWQGNTRTSDHRSAPAMSRHAAAETAARNKERRPIWDDIDFELPVDVPQGDVQICMEGDIRLSFVQTKKARGERKISLGIAN